MPIAYLLVLAMLGAFIRGSSAIRCYQCIHERCGESTTNLEVVDCSSDQVCGKLKADSVKLAVGKKTYIFLVASCNYQL